MITEDPVRTKLQANKKRRYTIYVSADNDNKNRLISQIITGVQNKSRNESEFSRGMTCFPTNGSRSQVSAASRVIISSNRNNTEEQSVVIYDHLGNLVTNTWLAGLVPEENVNRALFNINIGNSLIINKVHKNKDKVIWR